MFLQYTITKTLYVAEYNIILYRLLFLLKKPRKVCAMNDAYDQFSPHPRMCWSHLHCIFTKKFLPHFTELFTKHLRFLPRDFTSTRFFSPGVFQALGFFRCGFCYNSIFFTWGFVSIKFFVMNRNRHRSRKGCSSYSCEQSMIRGWNSVNLGFSLISMIIATESHNNILL